MSAELIATRSQRTFKFHQLFTSLPMTVILLITLLSVAGEMFHTRVLEVGGATWPDYTYLRIFEHIDPPNCTVKSDLDQAVTQELARQRKVAASDPMQDLLATATPSDIRKAFETRNQLCQQELADYQRISKQYHWPVQAYSFAEKLLSHMVTLATSNRRVLLGLMILFCATAATLRREHIALRQVQTQRDEQVATGSQIAANGILAVSAYVFRHQEYAAAEQGMPLFNLFMHDCFVIGFSLLTIISIAQWYRPKEYKEEGSWGKAALCTPLYAFMCFNAAIHFASYGFYHGIHVYMNVLLENSALFLNIGLYVWVGVLLVRTQLPSRIFDLIRVWQLPPKWLGLVMLALTAPPTAYTGASAILILAAGPALYQELRRAGQTEQLALATTALAGSMGTMLRPCLLVFIVAALNNSVTTDELYSAGARVLCVTLSIYGLYVFLIGGRSEHKMAPLAEAIPNAAHCFLRLIPYIGIFAAVILGWQFVMGRPMNEFSAPAILPIIMLSIVTYERFILKQTDMDSDGKDYSPHREMFNSIARASNQAAPLVGALMLLIALSMSTGGMIEHSGMLYIFPETFAEPWIALTTLMVVLVIVGMFMDPYGAVILVNATLAPIAANNGIHPIHFWIVTLLAFEMGYLTPPVALNHLITRQVVGAPTEWESLHGTFWQRNFRIIFPILVMSTALIIVTFLPLHWPNLFF